MYSYYLDDLNNIFLLYLFGNNLTVGGMPQGKSLPEEFARVVRGKDFYHVGGGGALSPLRGDVPVSDSEHGSIVVSPYAVSGHRMFKLFSSPHVRVLVVLSQSWPGKPVSHSQI